MINNYPLTNIYERPSGYANLSSQMLYGEKFKIISKKKKWFKIKTEFDNYVGYVRKKKFLEKFESTNKVYKLKTRIFKKLNNKLTPTKKFLFFASKVSIYDKNNKYVKYDINKWIKRSDIKKIHHREKNFSKIIKSFLNTKYLWGGKSSLGIDCSALIQIFFFYNGLFFPRDTKDQIKFLNKITKRNAYDKKYLIFWKGHVAYCLNNKNLIHAYGPKKKVLVMNIKKAINNIQKKSNLKIQGIRKIDVN